MRTPILMLGLLALATPAGAETVDISGQPLYVTKADCNALVAYRQAPGVAYQPGVGANGKYVAPADVPGGNYQNLVPTNGASFNLNINPMNYAQRNSAQTAVNNSSAAVTKNNQTTAAAQAKATTLSQTLTSLQTTQTQLNTQQTTYNNQLTATKAQIIAQTGGAAQTNTAILNSRNVQIEQATKAMTGSAAYQQLQSAKTANTQAIASTNTAITANNQVIAQASTNSTQLQNNLTAAEAKASANTQSPFANTAMPVGNVNVDLKTGAVTFNGRPLTSPQEQMVSDACRRAGY